MGRVGGDSDTCPHSPSLLGQPVVQTKAGDVLKIGGVVRRQREIMDQSRRSDHQIRRRDGDPLLQQRSSYVSKLLGARGIEIYQMDFLQQIGDQDQQPIGLGMLVRSGIQFSQSHGGNRYLIGVLDETVGQLRRTPHVGRTDVRIEKEIHGFPRSGICGRRSHFRA